jgi:Dolichyl-phosphate-mannose-protein mannosyltransferase
VNAETTAPPRLTLARVRALDVRWLLPAAVGFVLVLPSVVWAFQDRSIWPWDPAWYGEVSVDLWATLRTDTGSWATAMADAFGTKPPAIAWLGQFFVPLGHLGIDESTALLLSVLTVQAASLGLVFAACRRLHLSNLGSAIAALLMAASPLFTSMSHEYFAEPIQTFAIVWAIYALASASERPFAMTAAQLPGIAALGMLAKLSTPAYIGAPLIGAALLAIRRPGGGRRSFLASWGEARVIASAVVSAALVFGAVGWYEVNYSAAVAHAQLASADTGLYGVNQGFAKQIPAWVRRLRDAAVLPHVGVALFLLALVSLALLIRKRGIRPTFGPRFAVVATGIVTVALVLILFASQPNNDVRYLLPLIPYIAVIFAAVIDTSGSQGIAVASAGLLLIEFGLVQLQSFGEKPISSMTYAALTAPQPATTFSRELENVVRETCRPESSGQINMVGADYPWFNHNTLQMLASEQYAEKGLHCYYTALGYAESNPNVAWTRLMTFKSPYYISIDYGDRSNSLPEAQRALIYPSDPFNVINKNVFQRAKASKLYRVVDGTTEAGLVVLQANTVGK